MNQKKAIDAIYRKFGKRPASPDELDIPLLFEKLPEETGIEVVGNDLVIGSLPPASPFRIIPVSHIHAIIEFDESIAIVLHSTILFLSKETGTLHVHLKTLKPSLLDRIKDLLPG